MTFPTGDANYFEDFSIGDRFTHMRGRTVENFDNYLITHLTLNTAQSHFDLGFAREVMDGMFTERLVMGGVTIAIVVGLTSEDMSENATADLSMTDIRLASPVYRGDTLRATSTVLDLRPHESRSDLGLMTYEFVGRKDDGQQVVSGKRTVALKRRPA